MMIVYAEKWWIPLLRCLLFLIIGAMAVVRPIHTLSIIFVLFALYLILDGFLTGVLSFYNRSVARSWQLFLVEGFLGLMLGLFALTWPSMTALIAVYVFAFWALITGILEIITGIQMRQIVKREWLMFLIGVFSVMLSIALFFRPRIGAVTLTILLGLFMSLFSVVQVFWAFRLRKYWNSSDFTVILTRYRQTLL